MEEQVENLGMLELVKEYKRLEVRTGAIELEVRRRTGMEIEEFIDGMRQLLAPAAPRVIPGVKDNLNVPNPKLRP